MTDAMLVSKSVLSRDCGMAKPQLVSTEWWGICKAFIAWNRYVLVVARLVEIALLNRNGKKRKQPVFNMERTRALE